MTRSKDEQFMAHACRLALLGQGRTKPNPMVGAVLVKGETIIGTGYHKRPGTPHAEVIAIEHATDDPRGATLYVNLEPCCHFGRTPPCVDYILSKGIQRVVIGTSDPNPLVNGKSIDKLRRHAVHVHVGVLEDRCKRINEVFLKYMKEKTPFVILKAALTLDGKIASHTRQSKWITSEKSRLRVHQLRSLVDAVVVGIGTVLHDDPLLTVRGIKDGNNPLRVIVDSTLRIPCTAKVLSGLDKAKTLVATTTRAPGEKIQTLRNMGVEVQIFNTDPAGKVPVGVLFKSLGEAGHQSILIEGGSRIFTNALENELVDKLVLFVAPIIMGGDEAPGFFEGKGFSSPAECPRVAQVEVRKSGPDYLVQGYLEGRQALL